VETALKQTGSTGFGSFAGLAAVFAAGLGVGLLSRIYFNGALTRRVRGPDHASAAPPTPQALGMMIATGLGMHNITEGFGIAAPMTMAAKPVSWGFLGLTGLVGGAPTFVGSLVGYLFRSDLVYVLFLALAAGALVYVLNELFVLGRRITTPGVMGWAC
jgi:hypothetical protein